jgi:formylglycine-generating enzyme required for sulfatase activity
MIRIPSTVSLNYDYEMTRDFMMMTTEVTRSLFSVIMNYNPSGYSCSADCPVETVYRREAMLFANKISDITELPNCYDCQFDAEGGLLSCSIAVDYQSDFTSCLGYRIPTEIEHMYATQSGSTEQIWTPAGGGSTTNHNCDAEMPINDGENNPLLVDYAWYCANTSSPQLVASKLPNAYGLYDMLGNVWEWTQDNVYKYSHWSYSTVPYNPIDPYAQLGTLEVVRGGSFYENSSLSYSSRWYLNSNYRHNRIGFRLVKTVNNLPKKPQVWLEEQSDGSLLCKITEESYDLENDEITYTFSWNFNDASYEDETLQTIYAGDTLPSEILQDGDIWTCQVTPNDNFGIGFTATESYLVQSNPDIHTVLLSNSDEDSIDFLRISAGDDPLGRYSLHQGMWVLSTEVHQLYYQYLIDQNPADNSDCPQCPVENTSKYDAMVFANEMSRWSELEMCYDCTFEWDFNLRTVTECSIKETFLTEEQTLYDCEGYRLPTEAEWEYIARSETVSDIATSPSATFIISDQCSSNVLSDGTMLEDYAWLCSNTSNTQPIADKLPNPFGIYDLHGNVSEWVQDSYQATFPNGESNPIYLDGNFGLTHGGNKSSSPNQLKADYRNIILDDIRTDNIGFRIVRSILE